MQLNMAKYFLLVSVSFFLLVSSVNAAIYKCRNSQGEIEFKQIPCMNESLKVFNSKGKKMRTSKGGVSYTRNSITANNVTMPVETAVAVYFKRKNKINVFFSHRKLSQNEIEQLKNDKAEVIMWGQASPDIDKWKKHPSADMDLYFKENRPHTPENITNYKFNLNNLTREPTQNKIASGGKNVIDDFQKFDLKIDGKSSKIVFDFVDEKQQSGVEYQWSLSFEVPIIIAK